MRTSLTLYHLRIALPLAFGLPHLAAAQRAAAPAAKTTIAAARTFGFASDVIGREPTQFLPMVGNWVVTNDGGKRVLMVDGRIWKKGQPAGGLADKARAIYGAEHEEFIDNVKAFAYFPIAVNKTVPDFSNGEISVRFKMIGGALDRCAGILFNVKPNGDYLTVRFNGTEDNVVLWTFKEGKRSFVKRGAETVPLELGTWNELRVVVAGTSLKAYLNGKLNLEFTLPEPVTGKVGLWSKTDSMTLFDAFTVTPGAR
jgi:hypothetical protein